MTQYQDTGMMNYDQPTKQKGWFGRNWLWFIPLVVGLPLCCCCGGPIGLMWFGLSVIFDSPPYNDTIALAEQNPVVQQEIGTPIDAPDGFMDLIDVEQQGGEIDTDGFSFYAEVPISGPNGTGWLTIDATSNDGTNWSYNTQQVLLDSTGETVDLLNGGASDGSAAEEAE